MMRLPLLLSCLLLCLLCSACGSDTPATGDPAKSGGAEMDGHGEKKPLGPMTVGAHTFTLVQFGDVEAGHEAAFELEFAAGKARPDTVRGWIGVESGQGSMKAKFGKEGDTALHAHLDVPKPIPAGSKVWIEVEEDAGTQRGSMAWK